MAAIYYLNWDRESEFDGGASELFHDVSTGTVPDRLDRDDFDRLYRKVRELPVDVDDPEVLWRQWNRGSGRESRAFLGTRYCDPCDQGFTSVDDAYHHFYHDHYTAQEADLDEFFEYVRGVRSMSAGDVVELDDTYFLAASIGWQELDIVEGGPGE